MSLSAHKIVEMFWSCGLLVLFHFLLHFTIYFYSPKEYINHYILIVGQKMKKRAKNEKRKDFLFLTLKNKKLLTLIAISLIIILLSSICLVFVYQESRSKEEEGAGIDEDGIIDDTISPLGVLSATILIGKIKQCH